MTDVAPTFTAVGDSAIAVRLAAALSPETSARVAEMVAALDMAAAELPWLVEVVPSYAAVLVIYDVATAAADTVIAALRAVLEIPSPGSPRASGEGRKVAPPAPGPRRCLELLVIYDAAVAPDLADVAARTGFSVEEVVRRHTAPIYRVAMLGFRPGFPYLLGLDPALAVPRLSTPRARVAAGAVGIAGLQTGIYPVDGPGGWRIVGLTRDRLFDPGAADPFRLRPGDDVRLVPAPL